MYQELQHTCTAIFLLGITSFKSFKLTFPFCFEILSLDPCRLQLQNVVVKCAKEF